MHNGQSGAAIAVRVTPRASKNAIKEIMNDGTIKVHLTAPADDKKINQSLVDFLSKVLEIPANRVEIVAGQTGHDKLVSIIDLEAQEVHERILKSLT
jgi:uncharacterized protein (TIGR00251 family)